MLIAQISDPHIKPEGVLAYGHIDTSAFLARAVDYIRRDQRVADAPLLRGRHRHRAVS